MSPELRLVIDFCLKHAESSPVRERVSLYRGVAQICAEAKTCASLNALANELEAADRNCREFKFRFVEGGK
jgi:hypothetical protein